MNTSVVMSTYNGEQYIKEQLDSLRRQTKQPDEVLIFDDCSTDNTAHIVEKYIQNNDLKNWRIEVNQKNKGWRKNFMEGMWESHGDIVFPCDQDDIWLPNKIATMSKLMENNKQIQLLVSNYIEFFDNGYINFGPWKNEKILQKIPLKKNYMSVDAPGCVYCVRRDLLDNSKKYWRKEFGHDTLLWRMAELADSLYAIKQPTIKWRKHNNSSYSKEALLLKTQNEKKKWIAASIQFNELMFEYVKDQSLTVDSKILMKNSRWLSLRKKFYETRNFFYGIQLFRYWDIYPRYRQLLGDWYLVLFNK